MILIILKTYDGLQTQFWIIFYPSGQKSVNNRYLSTKWVARQFQNTKEVLTVALKGKKIIIWWNMLKILIIAHRWRVGIRIQSFQFYDQAFWKQSPFWNFCKSFIFKGISKFQQKYRVNNEEA